MNHRLFAIVVSAGVLCQVAFAEEAAPPATADKPAAAPKIEFDKMVYDFGSTSLVQSLAGTFTFSNKGDGPLELKQPTTSCGCTVAKLKSDKLAPGETGELSFTLSVAGMSRGRAEKHITVQSNDPQSPAVNLTVKAEIMPVFDYNPQAVMLGDMHKGETTNVTIQVKRIDGKPLNLTKVEPMSNAGVVRPKLVAAEGTNDSAQIEVEVMAEGTPRRFNESVKVFGDNPNQPVFNIPVSGRFVGDLSVNPEAVFWGIADPERWPGPRPETMTTRKVTVVASHAEKPIELKNASSTLSDLTVSIVTVETGKTYEVVAVLAQPPKESKSGTIHFETNLESQPSVDIPVTINVLRRG
jgi:hypothetical protein